MLLSLAFACSGLTIYMVWRSLALGEAVQREAMAVRRCVILMSEAERSRISREQLAAATHERDNLRSRLNAARQRIDVLLERLPHEPPTPAAEVPVDGAAGRSPT